MSEISMLTPSPHDIGQLFDRPTIINDIIAQDRAAFYAHSDRTRYNKLQYPAAALRYFIPPRLFELAGNPKDVRLVAVEQKNAYLNILVTDHRDYPISDPHSFRRYAKEYLRLKSRGPIDITNNLPRPPNIDMFHGEHVELVEQGAIGLNDYVFLDVCMVADNKQLEVLNYIDRLGKRHLGIGKSFYTRLREIAKASNLRFITGWNSDENISFFTDKDYGLGRSTLNEIQTQLRKQFLDLPKTPAMGLAADFFTIDFLYPEDKGKYLIKQHLIKAKL